MKILKRSAKFQPLNNSVVHLNSANAKLKIPKRTKLFVDQTLRERDNGPGLVFNALKVIS